MYTVYTMDDSTKIDTPNIVDINDIDDRLSLFPRRRGSQHTRLKPEFVCWLSTVHSTRVIWFRIRYSWSKSGYRYTE